MATNRLLPPADLLTDRMRNFRDCGKRIPLKHRIF
jgi:hypothetical protein